MGAPLNKLNQRIKDLMDGGTPEKDAIRSVLTDKQLAACSTRLKGGTLRDCVKASMTPAVFKSIGKKAENKTEDEIFNYLQRRYMELMREEAEKETLLTMKERRQFLAGVVRSAPGELDGSSPYVQMCETRTLKDGSPISRVTMPDKLRALELDAKMAGEMSDQGTSPQINIAMILSRLPQTSLVPQENALLSGSVNVSTQQIKTSHALREQVVEALPVADEEDMRDMV